MIIIKAIFIISFDESIACVTLDIGEATIAIPSFCSYKIFDINISV